MLLRVLVTLCICVQGLFTFFSCAQKPIVCRNVSSIDAIYQNHKLSSQNLKKMSKSASVTLYQSVLRPSLFSKCDYFPSDSVYAQNLAARCGSLSSLFKTYDRFIREPDAGYLGLPVVTMKHGLQFIDMPTSCNIF